MCCGDSSMLERKPIGVNLRRTLVERHPKTSNEVLWVALCVWPDGVLVLQKQIRMFFRLQRMSVYFAKLLESKAHPLWGLDNPIDPTGFARQVLLL